MKRFILMAVIVAIAVALVTTPVLTVVAPFVSVWELDNNKITHIAGSDSVVIDTKLVVQATAVFDAAYLRVVDADSLVMSKKYIDNVVGGTGSDTSLFLSEAIATGTRTVFWSNDSLFFKVGNDTILIIVDNGTSTSFTSADNTTGITFKSNLDMNGNIITSVDRITVDTIFSLGDILIDALTGNNIYIELTNDTAWTFSTNRLTGEANATIVLDSLEGIGAIITSSSQFFIDGTTNQPQLRIQAHSTQDSDIVRIEASDGTKLLSVDGDGELEIVHVASHVGSRAFKIEMDAAAQVGAAGMSIELETGTMPADREAQGILINIDQSASTGGEVHGIDILSTSTGSATVTALETGVGIAPIRHESGAFVNLTFAEKRGSGAYIDWVTEGNSSASDITLWDAVNDSVFVGVSTTWSELQFIWEIAATKDMRFDFSYSSGAGAWTTFAPADGTSGATNNGVVAWTAADLSGWSSESVDGDAAFWIVMVRTRNSGTNPTEDLAKTAVATEFEWDKDGNISVHAIIADSIAAFAGGNILVTNNFDLDDNDIIGIEALEVDTLRNDGGVIEFAGVNIANVDSLDVAKYTDNSVKENDINWGSGGGTQVDITDIPSDNDWSTTYWGASGGAVAVDLGATGLVWKSNGLTSAPTWQTDNTGGAADTSLVLAEVTDGNDVVRWDTDSLLIYETGDTLLKLYLSPNNDTTFFSAEGTVNFFNFTPAVNFEDNVIMESDFTVLNTIRLEGATVDAFQHIIQTVDVTVSDKILNLPNDQIDAGDVLVGSSAQNLTYLGLATTEIVVGDGSGAPSAVSLSADVTMSNTGVVTIQDNAVQESDVDITNAGSAADILTQGAGDDFTWVTELADGNIPDHTGDVTGGTALTITPQIIVNDDIDTTAENFVFDGAYHVTSAFADSQFMSKKYIDDQTGGGNTFKVGVADVFAIQDSVNFQDNADINFVLNTAADVDEITASYVAGSMVNADVNASAGIVYSKLTFSNNIDSADLGPNSAGESELDLGFGAQQIGIEDMNSSNDWSTMYWGASGVAFSVDLPVSGLVWKSNGIASAPSWQTDAGAGLTFFTEADDNDTSVFTATGPNTTVGFNDQLTMQGNSITGVSSLTASSFIKLTGSANLDINVNNTSAATAQLILDVDDAGTGDAKVKFVVVSENFSMGIDNTDADAFVISNDANLGTNNVIRITPSTQVIQFNGAYSFPTSDGSINQILKTDGSGTLTFQADNSGGAADTSLILAEVNDGSDVVKWSNSGDDTLLVYETGDTLLKLVIVGDGTGDTTSFLQEGQFTTFMFNNAVLITGDAEFRGDIILEGSSVDAFEQIITTENLAAADHTFRFPDDEMVAGDILVASGTSNLAYLNLATTEIVIGDGVGPPTAAALSGDVTMDNAGVVTIGTAKIDSLMFNQVEIGEWMEDTLAVANHTWTGTLNFGGATSLEIPNATNPAATLVGHVFFDTDDSALAIFDGAREVLAPVHFTKEFTIWDPETITDTIPIIEVDSMIAQGGITLESFSATTNLDGTYTLNLYEFTGADPPVRVGAGTIATLGFAAGDQRDATQTFSDDGIGRGNMVYILTPSTDIDWVKVKIRYYINAND